MVDGFLGLRHHAVICGNDQDDDVGHLGAAGAHLGEGLVAGGVDKDHHPSVGCFDPRCTDVLGDAAGFLFGDAARADGVQQRGLSVIHVTHDGYDRRAGHLRADRFFALSRARTR